MNLLDTSFRLLLFSTFAVTVLSVLDDTLARRADLEIGGSIKNSIGRRHRSAFRLLRKRAAQSSGGSGGSCQKCSKRKCKAGKVRNPITCKCQGGTDDKKDQPNNNDNKGKCKDGEVLDPAEGKQETTTANPKCIPDDASKCKAGEVPASRRKDETGPKDSIECAPDSKEEEKPKCKTNEYQFVEVWQGEGGKSAKYSCKKTRQFERKKDSKFTESLNRRKEKYEEDKKKEQADADKRTEDRKNEADKKKAEEIDRKKSRAGKCLMIVPLTDVVGQSGFEYSQDYFDEDFANSDDEMLKLLPEDMPDPPDDKVSEEEYIQKYIEINDSINQPYMQTTIARKLHKRFIPLLAMLGRIASVGARIAAQGGRMAQLLGKGGIRLARAGQSKIPRQDMSKAANGISKNKNWKNCLKGLDPEMPDIKF